MHHWKLIRRFFRLTGVPFAILLMGLLAPANADLIVSFGSSTATVGGSQVIDVLLTNTGSAVTVDGFSFDFTTSNPFITFMQANTSTTTDPYIFAGDSKFGPIISTTPPPNGKTVIATDVAATCCGYALGSGSTIALGEVLFQVAANATVGTASLISDQSGTSLSDMNGRGIPITTLTNGQITVTTVPEPSLFAPVALFFVTVAGIRRRRLTRKKLSPPREA
jgi:hypothetical protein